MDESADVKGDFYASKPTYGFLNILQCFLCIILWFFLSKKPWEDCRPILIINRNTFLLSSLTLYQWGIFVDQIRTLNICLQSRNFICPVVRTFFRLQGALNLLHIIQRMLINFAFLKMGLKLNMTLNINFPIEFN
jgi:hypothetical protein